LYGYETSSLRQRETRRLTVFEKRGAEEDIWASKDKVKGQWTIMHEELYDLHSSPHIIRASK